MKLPIALRALPVALLTVATTVGHAATRQTKAEVEDIGEIAEAAPADGKDAKDAKATPEPPVKHFRFNVGARTQYTTNAELHGDHDSSDVIFFPSIEAGFNTKLGTKFSFDSALRVESGIYADNSNRSFIGYSLQNTLDYRPASNLPRIFVGFEPYRYDGFDKGGLISEALAVSVGTDYGYAFNNGKSLLFVGYTFADHFSNPEIDSRRVNTAIAGITHTFLPKLTGQAFYQFEYSDYYRIDRDDARNVLGVSLTYQFTQHIFSTLTANWVDNNSSDERASYQSAGASLGINVQY